jgi:hypothetical protein
VDNSYYNYDQVMINGQKVITIGALYDEDFRQWLAGGKFLDVNNTLSREQGYYAINSVSDLKALLVFGQDASLKFRLKNDLDLVNDPGFYIPYLAGEFDGNGHTITNLSFTSDSVASVGLFGCLAPEAKVTAVGAENVDLTACAGVGGLVGENRGGVVTYSYSSGKLTGVSCVGGLVGDNAGSLSNCYSNASVTGYEFVGGLVGNNGGSVSYSYSGSSVIGADRVGGLVARNWDGTVDNSFWNRETSGIDVSDGGTGKTTADMKSVTTFSDAGWSVVTVAGPGTRNTAYIWNIVDGQTYPFLSWQPVP